MGNRPMKYTYSPNGKPVFFYAADALKDTADFFSTILQNEDAAHHVLRDNHTLQIGWGFYKILQKGGEYQVMACDLLGNPFQAMTEDLSLSLMIFERQNRIINSTKIVPEHTTSFQDTMIVQRAAVNAPRIYLQRNEPASREDSGWYMGAIDEKASDDPSEYARLYTYQLLRICKEALSVMQLPVGTLCVFENGRLIEAVDQDNRKIL